MDYTQAVTRLPQLRERLVQGDGALSVDESAELDQLARSVPKLISTLPDVLPDRSNFRHNAALTEMTNKLVHHLDRSRPLAVVRPLPSFLCCRGEVSDVLWNVIHLGAGTDSDSVLHRRYAHAQYPLHDVREVPSDSRGIMITRYSVYRKTIFRDISPGSLFLRNKSYFLAYGHVVWAKLASAPWLYAGGSKAVLQAQKVLPYFGSGNF